jgi:hypothetical protein
LHTTLAIGYVRGADDRLELDPDLRIREVLSLVFRKFGEIGSVRQLALWLRQGGLSCRLPSMARRTDRAVAPTRYHAIIGC